MTYNVSCEPFQTAHIIKGNANQTDWNIILLFFSPRTAVVVGIGDRSLPGRAWLLAGKEGHTIKYKC